MIGNIFSVCTEMVPFCIVLIFLISLSAKTGQTACQGSIAVILTYTASEKDWLYPNFFYAGIYSTRSGLESQHQVHRSQTTWLLV